MVPKNLGFRFTLVSYNILSQTLLNDHNYLYTSCNPKDLEWPKRGHRIVSELLDNKADIICLQEVESEHLQSLYRPRLARHGYECLYKKKTGYKIDGCAIFYKETLFHLLSHKGIEFNRIDTTNLLNRDNVGLIAVLKPKIQTRSSSSQLVVANTHLFFNPRRNDIRLAQLKLFLSEIEEVSFMNQEKSEQNLHPTILCGDFNSIPESEVNRFILQNHTRRRTRIENDDKTNVKDIVSKETKNPAAQTQNSEERVTELNHHLKFKSVYPTKDKDGEPFVSTLSNCIVDYIFYTPKLHLESYRELLTEAQLDEVGPIPNSAFPSDHLTLEAKFTMK